MDVYEAEIQTSALMMPRPEIKPKKTTIFQVVKLAKSMKLNESKNKSDKSGAAALHYKRRMAVTS